MDDNRFEAFTGVGLVTGHNIAPTVQQIVTGFPVAYDCLSTGINVKS